MKQLLILSGKGGTGKTTVAGAFIHLSHAKAYADCDVDAPNLHLILKRNEIPKQSDFYGMAKAKINTDLCVYCGKCQQNCRFDAISSDIYYEVEPFACEGCGVCEAVCSSGAISLYPHNAGKLKLYTGDDTIFSTATLNMGSGTSGKLVTEVKKQLKANAGNAELTIIDGSPGIGCPVIASISGVDLVLIVSEPSLSGISDMERIVETAQKFGTKTAVCINKYDTNKENSQKIIAFCNDHNLPFVGTIPFDMAAVKAINNAKSIVEVDCPAGNAAKEVYQNTMTLLSDRGGI